jgi:CRISPR/Cas system-associated exonuclease Cas4 (RecB family)
VVQPIILRHELQALWVSLLSEAIYCEQKAVLSLVHPEAETESEPMKAGTAAHLVLEAEAEKIERDELKRRIAAGAEVRLREFPLKAEIHGIPLYGKIDHVELEGQRALWVYEFKFSRHSHRLFPNHQLQLSLYGLLLEANRFDVSDLICAAVIVPPHPGRSGRPARTNPKLANAAITTSKELRAADGLRRYGRLFREGFAVHAFKYDAAQAERDFTRAVGYWIGEREANRADSKVKCRSCAFNAQNLCQVALAPFGPPRRA